MPNDKSKRMVRLTRADRRKQLLEHAQRLLSEQGFSALTLEEVARAAGVSESVVTGHFSTKALLFAGILDELRRVTLVCWHSEPVEGSDPLGRLHRVIEVYLQTVREYADRFRGVHRVLCEVADPEIQGLLRGFYGECEAFLAGIIAEGQQTGVFRRSLNPRIGAWELIRSALGYTLTLPLGVPLYAEPDYLPRAIECLLHCLLKTDV